MVQYVRAAKMNENCEIEKNEYGLDLTIKFRQIVYRNNGHLDNLNLRYFERETDWQRGNSCCSCKRIYSSRGRAVTWQMTGAANIFQTSAS